jgi:hypothetical protein
VTPERQSPSGMVCLMGSCTAGAVAATGLRMVLLTLRALNGGDGGVTPAWSPSRRVGCPRFRMLDGASGETRAVLVPEPVSTGIGLEIFAYAVGIGGGGLGGGLC